MEYEVVLQLLHLILELLRRQSSESSAKFRWMQIKAQPQRAVSCAIVWIMKPSLDAVAAGSDV